MFGIVSSDEFEDQLSELNKPAQKSARVVNFDRGRNEKKETPEEIRKVIAEESINGTPAKELSELFGVSLSSVSAYKNGATSTATYNEKDESLTLHTEKVREE